MPEPIYFLCIDGSRVGELSNPQRLDMFWWEYSITPTTENNASMIRTPLLWEGVDFTITDVNGRQPNPNTFSGGYAKFCAGETDRLSFRSLPPPHSVQ